MKYLIFEDNAVGHHMEYLHHLATYISKNNKHDNFIFLLTPDFHEIWKLREWPIESNITYKFLEKDQVEHIFQISSNRVLKSRELSKILSQNIDKYKPDRVILNDLAPFLPSLPFYLHQKNIINGIIYKIPRYRPNSSLLSRIRDGIMMIVLAKFKIFHKVFLLNDEHSPQFYNYKYKSETFSYLPDPINIVISTRQKNTISNDKKIILFHGGVLGERKGTFKIIDAIKSLPKSDLQQFKLRMIGSALNEIDRQKIISFVKEYNTQLDIKFSDKFVSFIELQKELRSADYVLIPYENWEQSSGFLGYAAFYNIPVIGPSEGLLGQIIKDYSLGITINEISIKSINNVLKTLTKNVRVQSQKYIEERSVSKFSEIILS